MFTFGSGRAPYPTVYTVTSPKKSSKKDTPPPSPLKETPSSPDSLEPAIDGPPSPERIRAYTEQMKRSSLFGNNSRTNTLSSGASSSRSRESTIASTDNVSLSRRSSSRSNASSMLRHDRPESVQIFGSLFSRSSRKTKRDAHNLGLRSASSLGLDEMVVEEGSAKDHYNGKKSNSRRRRLISGPYNFQHVTHTRQDHLPDLGRTSRTELVSEFSAIRASQAPTHGELKGIRAEDLHFENFSSEALSVLPSEEAPPSTSPQTSPQRRVLRKSLQPAQTSPQRAMLYTKSHDNLRIAPPRPPRSPLSPTCPLALPARTSSRTASVLFDKFDPLATTTITRPHTNAGFRKPAPFILPSPPPTSDEQEQDGAHAVTTPGDEAWPLTASLSGNFGNELADVQEEEEDIMSKRSSRLSTASAELRMSQSVPALRLKSQAQVDRSEARMSTTLGQPLTAAAFSAPKQVQTPTGFQFNDSWESDIDWCYENGEESCDYDHCSEEGDTPTETVATVVEEPLQLSLQTEERTYRGRFRPSLLVSSAFDAPELSPSSNDSTPSSDPRTPANFLRPSHIRSPSHASSFKESHGFHLSPTLLIPADFQSQMEQDALYTEHYGNDSSNGAIFMQDSYVHAISPIDEGESSTYSYRSSDFSRRSARSSSSTRASGTSRGSQDSMMLLRRSSSMTHAHHSIGSNSSLPDLVPSTLRQIDHDLSTSISVLTVSDEVVDSAPSPEIGGPHPALASMQHRRNKSLVLERELRNGETQLVLSNSAEQKKDNIDVLSSLSPVAEVFPHAPAEGKSLVHGRKTSAPEAVAPLREFKGRARASTVGGKRRGSYMLFPQI
ncbi:hypothetical protein IFR04_000655 [Cadophora malorum]|uniref:CRIB domain-containing protein n=1 Tax=Cadophora malorum TaxID=108018 RepID=A0A8H8BWE2_9HELO|nr:hypothetical protein IFR04_000655 [Cadophora malorum]